MYTSIGTYELSGGQLISNFETVGSGGVGTFTHSGGSNTISGDFIVGDGSTSNGTYELKGTGYLSSFSEIIGRSGMGKLTHSSGTNTMARLYLGFEALGNGTYELSDEGNMICPFQLVGYLGTGTFTQSGGTNTCTNLLCLGNQSTSSGTYNLNGGTLVLNAFFPGSGAAFFNFGGGTLQACNGFTYSPQMTLTGTGGDANVDTAGYTVTFSSPLIGLGGLNKKGTGTLTLSATNTYSGTTTISMGTLALSGTGTLANSNVIDVASGSMFLVSAVNDGFSLGTGQTLKGSGTIIGNLTVKGVHAPGDSPGIETVQGNYNLQGQLQIELMGTMAGNGYDQVLLGVNGSSKFNATLGGLLTLDWTGMNGSTDASKLWILENDTAGTLSGEFSNYANGASLGLHDGREWQIWYGADATTGNLTGGNDVLIAPVPEPAAIILLALAAFGLFGWMRKRQA
jgi:autotransporter-associated beta strand protein